MYESLIYFHDLGNTLIEYIESFINTAHEIHGWTTGMPHNDPIILLLASIMGTPFCSRNVPI